MSGGRWQRWEGFDETTRLRLVANDIDTLEAAVVELGHKLDAIKAVLTGVLVAVTVSAVMLALNLIVGTGK